MRVRQKAQFELVKRGDDGFKQLLATASNGRNPQLARIHGIWGIAQLTRKDAKYGNLLTILSGDKDPEIQAQAAKMIGDVRLKGAGDFLVPLLKYSPSLRVQFFAAEALGRTGG